MSYGMQRRYDRPASREAPPPTKPYEYTDFQKIVHSLPEDVSRFLAGGRGGSKSSCMAQDIGITCERHKAEARILFIRQGPYKALNDFVETLSKFFDLLWGSKAHSFNQGSHIWTVPTGSYLEFGILPDGEQGRRYYETAYQGRSFSHVYVDELQQYSRLEIVDLLISNLRGSIPTRITLAANPGGPGHQAIAARYIHNGVGDWKPFKLHREVRMPDGKMVDTTRTWISCPSTYLDNPHNGPDYLSNLAISCGNDIELLKAWVSGNWNIARGAYFAQVLDNPRIRFNWPVPEEWGSWKPDDWKFWLAFDHGTAAPAVCYVMAQSPGAEGPDGRYYSATSILMLDEYACHREGDLGRAFNWTIPQLAEKIKDLAARWHIAPRGLADDACFSDTGSMEGTIVDQYGKEGVSWQRARKGRRAPRFQKMKTMLKAAGKVDEQGLFVSERCSYWWATVPYLVHDPNDREVPLKCSTDHAADASGYGIQGLLSGGHVSVALGY